MDSSRIFAWAFSAGLTAFVALAAMAGPASAAANPLEAPLTAWSTAWKQVHSSAVHVPTAPRNAKATAGPGSLTVTWQTPASSGGATITSYRATASPGGKYCKTTALTCVIRGLTNGAAYTVTVRATNRIGTGGFSNSTAPAIPVGPPAAPTAVRGTPGDGFVDITWVEPKSNGGSPINGYTVTALPGGLTCATSGATTCRIDGLTNGTAYTFTVVANNALGTGAKSSASPAVVPLGRPAKPLPPTAKSIDRGLVVSWVAPNSGGSRIHNYTVTAEPSGKTCNSSGLSCTITNLENGSAYTLTVVATNSRGDSPPSDPSTPFTPFTKPSAVIKPTAQARPGSAVVAWEAPANNGSPISSYTVTSSPGRKSCTTTALTCTVIGLKNRTSYTFTVKATNAAGAGAASPASDPITPRAAPGHPGLPTVVGGNATVTVTWTAAPVVRGGAPITGYRVTSKPDGITCETSGALTCAVRNLTNGQRYTFTVQALSDVGPGLTSKRSGSVVPMTTPGVATAVVATPGRNRATVRWQQPTDNGGNAISGYTITSNPGGYTRTVRSTSVVFTGLTTGTSYTFTVVASNAAGNSSESEPSDPVEIPVIEAPPFSNGYWLGVDELNATISTSNANAWATAINMARPRVFRNQLHWSSLAPTKPSNPTDPSDPAYDWTKMDNFARLSKAVGAEPLLNFFDAPAWAEGPKRLASAAPGSWKPNIAALRAFSVAMATRYSGNFPDPDNAGSKLPRVRLFEAWNEPNYKLFLEPQFESVRGRRTLTVPSLYREMLNAIYDGIKSVQPDSIVMTSGLGPYGRSSKGVEIQPQSFLRDLLCMNGRPTFLRDAPCPVKPKFDSVAIHPYTLQGKPADKAKDPNGGGLGNTPDFVRAIAAAVRYDNVFPAGPKQLIATEFVWLTNPPGRVSVGGAKFGIAPTLAAQYTAETIYRLYRWGVSGAIWYGLRDRPNNWPGGLLFTGNSVAESIGKPGLTAFLTPFFASTTRTGIRYWAKSHCMGPNAIVTFEGKVGRTWTAFRSATPDADGVAEDTAARPRNVNLFRAIATDLTGCSMTSVEMPPGTR